ncbi:hypothetical protein ORN01_25815 [Bacillus cereus]|jgi:hypothetical protein|uniref:Uncharacterized protein n=9 Tax=Bacillaceae TaxID=186817 RepID=A0A9X8IX34_BACCE|nr:MULTISPECIES: hypothetical protein [Bacillus]MCO4219969.1 hypothetical protein [Bacillus sp. 10017]MEB4841081.1 hypothetical protein [Paenibacillus jamilae]TKV49317.1 hypothetical protein C1I58_01395 [Bacillus sp. PIC28]CEX14725.1 Uncharacterised protein [Streptococcus pneumoniae]AOM03543.1 hypothetical protein FORC24_0253 [Bacillus cereus]
MLLSYLFFSIAVISVIIKYLFIASHYLKYILMIEIMCPILSITLATLGKSGTQKIITIILKSLYFILFSSVALLNLRIIAFGK